VEAASIRSTETGPRKAKKASEAKRLKELSMDGLTRICLLGNSKMLWSLNWSIWLLLL